MTSVVAICNMALGHIGTKSTIASLDEASVEARLCGLFYDVSRDAALRAHPWGFATRRKALADLGSPPTGWAYRYEYPSDCLHARAMATLDRRPGGPFEVGVSVDAGGNDTRVILSDMAEATLIYTRRIVDPAVFDTEFVIALSWRLAAELAASLIGKSDVYERCVQMTRITSAAAIARDAGEAQADAPRDAAWIEAR